jgi:hypothetical protein
VRSTAPVAGGHSLVSLAEMNAAKTGFVRRACWLLLISICVFHAWSDGRHGIRMNELQRQGQSLESARDQINWLCSPLNIAAFTVLAVIAAMSIQWKRSG